MTGTRRSTRPGSIRQVRLRFWWAIQEATKMLDEADPDMRLRTVSAISTACGAYANLAMATIAGRRGVTSERSTARCLEPTCLYWQ